MKKLKTNFQNFKSEQTFFSVFNPSQKTKCAYLINLVTSHAMRKTPKANSQATCQQQNGNAPKIQCTGRT